MIKSIKTSESNRAIVTELTNKLSIGPENIIARVALAYSVSQGRKLNLSQIADSKGKEYSSNVLFGEYQEIPIQPTKYVMLTYWDSKESHEQFHKDPEILEGFKALVPYLASMPFEEFGEIIR